MTKELSAAEKAFQKSKAEFLALSHRTTKILTRERAALQRQIKRVNAQAKKLGGQIDAKRQRLAKTTSDKVRKTQRAQIAKLKVLRSDLRQEAADARVELASVRDDLASARHHLARALHIDKAIAGLERQWAKVTNRGKKKAAKKRTAKKRTATRKRTAAKKRPAARKKAPSPKATKKTVARKRRAAVAAESLPLELP